MDKKVLVFRSDWKFIYTFSLFSSSNWFSKSNFVITRSLEATLTFFES